MSTTADGVAEAGVAAVTAWVESDGQTLPRLSAGPTSTTPRSVAGSTTDWSPAAKAGVAGLMRHPAVKMRAWQAALESRRAASTHAAQRPAQQVPAMRAAFAASSLGRIGEPEKTAATICFLLSPAASHVSGQLMAGDGASHSR